MLAPRRREILQSCFLEPPASPVQIRGELGGLPAQMRHRRGEMHGVLAGAAADFKDAPSIGEVPPQDLEDRLAVARAGFGVGLRLEHQCA